MDRSSGQLKDEQLVRLVQRGQIDYYDEIMARYQNRLWRYSLFLINDPAAADDAVQETFIKAYLNLQGFNTSKKFSSWIYRIAHNESMNLIRKKRTQSLDDDERLSEKLASQAGYARLEEFVERQLERSLVRRCLSKLNMKYRDPLVLYYIEGGSYSDISHTLRLPTSTVGVRINRAKKLLKKICQEMGVRHAA